MGASAVRRREACKVKSIHIFCAILIQIYVSFRLEHNGAIEWFCVHINGLWLLEAWKMMMLNSVVL